ncbi:MAG TPA: hypothetical protein VHV82_02520 [Sporichthyaceae bacterium]|jgi:hypothetical protein|nr:hypothetical protein [Sporichthyaceae bacterium]
MSNDSSPIHLTRLLPYVFRALGDVLTDPNASNAEKLKAAELVFDLEASLE